jgi:hypothetical protein
MRRFALGTAVLVALALPAGAARYAVLAGNSGGGAGLEQLRYVNNDLTELRDVLLAFGGFEPKNIATLYNRTPSELVRTLAGLSALVSSANDDLVLFYYSGHADPRSLRMGSDRFALADLRATLDSMPARIRIAVLDACRSEGFTRAKGGKLDEPFLFKEDSKVSGTVVLYSSSSTENSQESDRYKNSIFTFHFINALRGCADMSQDGKITVNEAYQYSYGRTISSTVHSADGVQHPGYNFRIQGEGDIVLADLNLRTQGIMFGKGIGGGVSILDSAGALVADFVKENGSAFVVAVNPGGYRVVNSGGTGRSAASVLVTDRKIVEVRPADLVAVAVAGSTSKGERRPGFCLSVGLLGGGGHADLSSLSASMEQEFSDYAYFGMHPRFSMPANFLRFGGAVEVNPFGNLVLLWIGDGFHTEGSARYHGSRVNSVDGVAYGYELTTRHDASFVTLGTGPGFRVTRGPLRGLTIWAGICDIWIDIRVSSTFTDSLYSVSNSKSIRGGGTVTMPYLGLSYRYQVFPRVYVGAQAFYRYSRQAARLSDTPGYKVQLRGVNAALTVGVDVIKRWKHVEPEESEQ